MSSEGGGSIREIRKLRKSNGWSQNELSQKSGVSQPTISQIERGNRRFASHENIKKIANALNVRVEELE